MMISDVDQIEAFKKQAAFDDFVAHRLMKLQHVRLHNVNMSSFSEVKSWVVSSVNPIIIDYLTGNSVENFHNRHKISSVGSPKGLDSGVESKLSELALEVFSGSIKGLKKDRRNFVVRIGAVLRRLFQQR